MVEEWVSCPGFPSYAISSYGKIMRVVPANNSPVGHLLSVQKDKDGYSKVHLCRHGKVYRRSIARLVCEAFNGPCPGPEYEVAHGDGTRDNDHYSNLRWATAAENQQDRVLHGTETAGAKNPRAKLSEADVLYVRRSSESHAELARELGVTAPLICQIRKRTIWANV